MENIHKLSLEEICKQAMGIGLSMDLSDCHYGETTGASGFIERPTSYYFFLAGFVKLLRLTHILEIGTNYGGSIMSLSKGLQEDDVINSQLVTIDIIQKNNQGFDKYPHIKRIQGDSLNKQVITEATEYFNREIDLIYIDSLHEYDHTKENIDIYGAKLKPRYAILDDITQCDDMKKLWKELKKQYKLNAFDASDVAIRKGAGFGVIKLKD